MILFNVKLSELELISEAPNELNIFFQLNYSFPKMSLRSTFVELFSITKNVLLVLLSS